MHLVLVKAKKVIIPQKSLPRLTIIRAKKNPITFKTIMSIMMKILNLDQLNEKVI